MLIFLSEQREKNQAILLPNGQYECPYCGRIFDSYDQYEEHYGEKHGNWEYGECGIVQEPIIMQNGAYKCPIDEDIFQTREEYDKHCALDHVGISKSIVPSAGSKELKEKDMGKPQSIREYVKGGEQSYPATKNDIIDQANTAFAPRQVMNLLRDLPDRRYSSPDDVVSEVEKQKKKSGRQNT